MHVWPWTCARPTYTSPKYTHPKHTRSKDTLPKNTHPKYTRSKYTLPKHTSVKYTSPVLDGAQPGRAPDRETGLGKIALRNIPET